MPVQPDASSLRPRAPLAGSVPVVVVTGYLGAGKTSLLNHLLRSPGARLGVVVNDFGTLNVDAALVVGQVDEAAAISGGCLCCLPEAGGLDTALEKLANPRLRLDAILVEASGAADPIALAHLIRFSGVERVRPGGIVEVIDAVEHFNTVDTWPDPPRRFTAASLIVIGKTDLLTNDERETTVERIRERIRERNTGVPFVVAHRGRIDPALVFDTATMEDPSDELPIARLLREDTHSHHDHEHAQAVSVVLTGPVSPTALVDVLERPPVGAYRIKGRVRVLGPKAERGYLVNVVGRMIHVAALAEPPDVGELVAVGMGLDATRAEQTFRAVAATPAKHPDTAGLRRLRRYRRLSE